MVTGSKVKSCAEISIFCQLGKWGILGIIITGKTLRKRTDELLKQGADQEGF